MRNKISAAAILAIVLWTATVIAPHLHAQTNDSSGTKTVVPAIQVLDDKSLQTMLENMGYEPKKLKEGYVISIKQDTWTFYIQILLSPNGEKLGLNANLGSVEKPEEITASQWLELLAGNKDISPSYFYYDKKGTHLYLNRSLDNKAITAAQLRKNIENFCANQRETSQLWKFTK